MAYGKNKIGARIENCATWMQVLAARMLLIVAAVFTLGASWPSTSVAQPASPPVATSSLIVKLAPGLSASEQVAVVTRNGGVQTASVPALRLHTIQVDVDQLDAIAANYHADSQVLRVELNNVRQSNAIPSDPLYSQQWALPKIGWDLVFGNSNPGGTVVVAVLDTGIDATHPDLTANLVAGTSILDGSNGFIDPSGHGTMVAGAVAARTNSMPAEGIAGVAYAGVRLMPVTVLDADGLGQDSNVIEGVIWAADHGAHVIVMAFSNPGFSDSLQEAIDYAWSKNVVLVAATGNDGLGTPTYPAGDRGVIGVSATDENDALASFSNYGPSVFLAAPGTNILTTDIGSSYIAISGTSTSAALVAGAAAQMLAIDPTLTNGVVVGRLARTADPAGTQEETGNGRVNLARALLDTGTDFVQPAGAAPIGAGGPFVGPYRAAAISTTTTIASNNNPSNFGQPVTFTATITCGSTCTYAAGSTVDFKDGANNGCNGGTTLATVSALTGSGLTRQATFSTSSLAAGAHSIRACFNNGGSGSNPNAGSSPSGPLSQVVNGVAATTLNVSAASGTYGGITTLSATLMSGGSGVSGKTITFTLNGGAAGSGTTNASGLATLSNVSISTTLNAATYPTGVGASFAGDPNFSPSSGTAQLTISQASSSTTVTCSTSVTYSAAAQTPCTVSVTGAGGLNLTPTPTYSNNTNAGTATASYTYAGDGNYIGSNDSNTFTIAKANTATAVTSSVNPSNAGSSVTFTAGVTSVAGAVSGTVQFVVDGTNSGAPVALVSGQATWTTSALTTAKTYAVSANYIADTNFNPSSGSLTGGQIVVAGPLDHLVISPASATITAGESQSYTAEGFDAFGNSRGDVTAATAFSITDGSCTAASCTTPVAGDHTVSGNDAGKTGTATLTVLPGALKTFLVEAAGGGSIQPQTAGTPFNVRITARDQFNNPVTGFSGTVSITSSGALVGTPVTSGAFVNGVLLSESVTITSAQSGTTLTATGGGGNGTSNGFRVNPAGINNFLIEAAGGSNIGAQTAGVPFNIWITARDQFNNTVVNFAGGVSLSSNANLTIPLTATFTGTEDGILEVDGVVLTLAGQNKEITVTNAGANSGTSNDFTVNPGGVANFLVEKAGSGDIEPQTAHTPFDIWITARDAFNNTVINFTGPVALSTDAGLITPDTVVFDASDGGIHEANVTITQAGTNKHISASSDADTGTSNPFTVNKASATATLDAATLTQTYDGTGRIVTATTDPAGLTVHITYDGSSTPPINVGTYAVVATIDDEGYEGSANGMLTVSKRPITVTADAKTKVYGDPEPTLTYHITAGSLVAGDAFAGALTRVAGENVGSYAIQQGSLTLTNNYVLTYVGANLSITGRPITITADTKTKVYGDTEPALTYHITTGSLVAGDAFTGALTRVAGENVGSYAIQQGSLALNANYVLTYVGANLSVTARPITITADAKTKGYGDAEPTLTYHITSGSLVTGDSFTGALTRVAGENVGTYAIQQGTLALSNNYVLTYVGANLSITARPITITADAKTKVYGEGDPALTYQITSGSLVAGDNFSGALIRVAGENVATYAIQQGTVALSANYVLTYVGANLSITARPITVTADAKMKGYGDPEPVLTYHITTGSLVAGDAFTGALTRVAGENVGTYAIQQGTLALNNNYVLTYAGTNLTITARPITVTADTKSKGYGDLEPALTYHITTGSLVTGDGFTGALTRVAGENVGTYAIQQATLALTNNYVLTYVGANLTITVRPITITADVKSKVYGYVDPALTYHITTGSLVAGDAFTGALTRVAGENVGSYAIQQGTIALNSNYALTYISANLTITARPIAVTAAAKTKVYGDGDPGLTYQITSGSLVAGDNFSGGLTRVAGENVGTYAIQQGTLALANNYVLSYFGANLAITPRALAVSADNKTKIAGGVNPSLTGMIVGIQFNDNITASFYTTAVTLSLPGDYPITPTLIDPTSKLGNYAVTPVSGTLKVMPNAFPVLGTITAPVAPFALGTAVQISVPFSDADVTESKPYTATIDWGDGSTSSSSFADVGTITGTKTYAVSGIYVVSVSIRQDNFPDHFDTKTVEGYVVVYDAKNGFVTGGGWISSPAGAYAANPSLTGKANFGFVSKYQNGATQPTGNTEFQFQAGNFNFKSTLYDWLVISGGFKAQYKGSGTVNGQPGYGFMLTAIDGGSKGGGAPDTFRLKVWNAGGTVYDNQLNAPDTNDPTTQVSGGSIVIHK